MVSLLSQLIKPRQEGRRVYASNNGLKKQHGRSGFPSRSQNIQNSKLLPRDIDSKQPSIPVTTTMRIEEDGMELLPTPPALTIANFVETVNGQNITNVNYSHRVLQCFLSCVAVDELQGTKYGLATPTDIPVMLGYFDSKNFHQVLPNDTIYEGLVEYVAHQLSMDDDAYLLDTPITLTLRGDFDDTEIEELAKANSETASIETDFGGENSWEKLIEEVDKEISHNPHFYDNRESSDEDEQENEEENEENDNSGAIFSRTDPGLLKSYNVPPEAIITEEDAESFRRAHLRADRIFSYVADLKLMGSFHYAKRNYHLVRILEVRICQIRKQIKHVD
jgi:hypothetical protein